MSGSSPVPTSTRALGADLDAGRRVVHAALAVLFVAAAARLAVPLPVTPVPVSLQDLAVLMVGAVLGPAAGASALVAYLFVGALGAPVFSSGHAGLPWLLGPTGGYLLAYPVAAWVMGTAVQAVLPATAKEDGASSPAAWLARCVGLGLGALAAQAVVYAGGVAQLTLLGGGDFGTAVAMGVVPFLPGVAVKTVLLLAFLVALDRLGPSSFRRGARGAAPGAAGP